MNDPGGVAAVRVDPQFQAIGRPAVCVTVDRRHQLDPGGQEVGPLGGLVQRRSVLGQGDVKRLLGLLGSGLLRQVGQPLDLFGQVGRALTGPARIAAPIQGIKLRWTSSISSS